MKNLFKKAVSLTIALSTVAALSVSAFATEYEVEQESGAITVNVGDSLDSVSVATVAGEGIIPYTTSGAGQYAVAVVPFGFTGSEQNADSLIYYVNQADQTAITDIISNMLLKGAIKLNKDYEVRIGTNATVNGEAVALTSIVFKVVEESGEVTILYGDVTGEGTINNKDVAFLARYVAKWTGYDATTVDLEAADVALSANPTINNKDVAYLARFVAKWTGYETLPMN